VAAPSGATAAGDATAAAPDGTPSPAAADAAPAEGDAPAAGDANAAAGDQAGGDEAGGDEAGGGWDFDGVDPVEEDPPPAGDEAKPAGDDVDGWEVEDEVAAPTAAPTAAATAAPTQASKPKPRTGGAQAAARSRYRAKKRALNSVLARKGIRPGDVSAVDRPRRKMSRAAKRKRYGDAAGFAERALSAANSTKIDSAFVGKKLARLNKKYDSVSNQALKNKLKSTFAKVAKDFSKKNYAAANKRLNRAFATLKKAR